MRWVWVFALAAFVFVHDSFGQTSEPLIKSEVLSAFVWGEDVSAGAVSTTTKDPLTGNAIRVLAYAGIEVTSRIGFERVGIDQVGTFLNYTTIIVNSTDATLSVRYGGISVDGHVASPVWVVPAGKKLSKKERQRRPDAVEFGKIHCLTSGFLSSDNFFSANSSSRVFTVVPGSSVTISSVIRDPRSYHSFQCSIEGCYPIGTIRYYLTVDTKDFVFVWPAKSAVYCGT
jgi:hypothetical protein